MVVVLFADITEGSGLFGELGTTWALDVVSDVHVRLREVAERLRGRVIKTVGTEIMCVFEHTEHAAMASGEMHLAVRAGPDRGGARTGERPARPDVRLRIGLHLGPIIEEDGDVFGDTVNVAARLMAMAKADQTLAGGAVLDRLPHELRSSTRFVDEVSPRGKSASIEIYEILWEVDDLTMAASVSPGPRLRKRHAKLTLRCDGAEYEVGATAPTLSLGRSADNDLVYPGGFASRRHAQIEYARGRFTIVDQSANGTYVLRQDGTMVPVRREQHVLDGMGKIYLGELPDRNPSAVILYECE